MTGTKKTSKSVTFEKEEDDVTPRKPRKLEITTQELSMTTLLLICFKCCVRLGNVGKPPHIFTLKNKLLQNVISSLVRLQLTASSELGKTVVAFLVNVQLELVKDQFSSALKEHQRQKHLLNIVMSSRNDVGERKPRFLIDIVDD